MFEHLHYVFGESVFQSEVTAQRHHLNRWFKATIRPLDGFVLICPLISDSAHGSGVQSTAIPFRHWFKWTGCITLGRLGFTRDPRIKTAFARTLSPVQREAFLDEFYQLVLFGRFGGISTAHAFYSLGQLGYFLGMDRWVNGPVRSVPSS